MTTKISAALAAAIDTAATDAATTAFATTAGAATTLEIRTGVKPTTPETAASGTLLATVMIGAWTGTSNGSGNVTAGDPGGVTISASGDAGYFRLKTSGDTALMDGDIANTGADLNLDDIALVAGGTLNLGAPILTIPVTANVA